MRYDDFRRRLVGAVLNAPGETPEALRRAVLEQGSIPPALAGYVDTVKRHAYKVTDADIAALQRAGHSVSSAHLRYLNPFPQNLGEVLAGFETVIIPEMNLGQLCTMIRAKYLVDAVAFSKVKGRPFQIREIVGKVEEYL